SSAANARTNVRGVFGFQTRRRIADLADGTSNTIAMGEVTSSTGGRDYLGGTARNRGDAVIDNPLACRLLGDPDGRLFNNTVPDADVARSRGQRWAAGSTAYTAVNTILPPNSPSCATGDFASAGQYPINS